MNRTLLAIMLVVGFPWSGFAESLNLTLEDALQRASEKSHLVLLAKTGSQAATAKKDLEKAPFSPHFSVGTGVAANYGFPLSIEGAAPSLFNVNFIETLYDRRQHKQVDSSALQAESAQVEVQSEQQKAALEAGQVYLELRNQRQRYEYYRTQLESLEKTREIVSAQVEGGVVQPSELTKAKLEVAKAKVALATYERNIQILEEQLKQLIGVAPDVSLSLGTEEVGGTLQEWSEETLLVAALDKDPTINQLLLQSQSYEVAEEGLNGWFRPVVNLVGRYDVFSQFNNYDKYFTNFQRNNAVLGFSIDFPLLRPGTNPEKRRLRAARDEALLKIKLRSDQIRLETQSEVANFAVLKAKEEAANLEVQVARENLQIAQAKYDEGRIPLAELEAARREEGSRWLQYLDVKLEQEKNRLNLRKEAGLLLK